MPASKDVDGGVSVKKLTKENSDLNKKCLELKKEKESLTKRCEEFKKSCNTLKDMLQKSSGKVKYISYFNIVISLTLVL